MSLVQVTPGQEYIVLEVDDVDVSTRMARCFDKTKAPLIASFRESPGGLLRIPANGERWTAKRLGWVWHLEAKLDSLVDHAFAQDNMTPGDARLQSDGALFIQMTSATMNGRGIGPDIRDTFYNDTGFDSVYLTSEAVSLMSTHPSLNGITLDSNLWTLGEDNRTISFHNTMGAGYMVVMYQSWSYAMDDATTVAGRAVISALESLVGVFQFIPVSGLSSAPQFGSFSVFKGNINVPVAGKTTGAQFGAIGINVTTRVSVTGKTSVGAFGTIAKVNHGIYVAGKTSAAAFGSVYNATGGINVPIAGKTSAAQFGAVIGKGNSFIAVTGKTTSAAFGAITTTQPDAMGAVFGGIIYGRDPLA